MQRATDAIAQEFETRRLLEVGDRVPDFALPNAVGKMIRLTEVGSNERIIVRSSHLDLDVQVFPASSSRRS